MLLTFFFEKDQDAGRYSYYGLMGLRHRGYKARYAVLSEGYLEVGEANLWTDSWSLPRGHAVLAGVAPIARLAVRGGNSRRIAVVSEGGCSPERILKILVRHKRIHDSASAVLSEESLDYCSFIALTNKGEFIIYRGRIGIRPLSLGGYGFESLYVATETAPITLMGGEYRYDVKPGQVIYGSRYWLDSLEIGGTRATSLFEYIYLARPDSLVDGVNVYTFRKVMGVRVAKRHRAHVDLVVGVPETALPYALGYAKEKGATLELAFISTLGRIRTAVAPLSQEERLMALSLKLNPVPDVFEGKSVAIVDDSVVTGLTLKTVIHRLRRTQAVKEVHIIVSSPKIVSSCPYNVNQADTKLLIARSLDDEKIIRALDADDLVWLPLNDALEYLNSFGIDPCRRCMGT